MDERCPRVLALAGCWYPDRDAPYHGIFIRRHLQAIARFADVAVLHLAISSDGPERPVVDCERLFGVLEAHVRIRGVPSAQGGRFGTQLTAWKAGHVGAAWLSRYWGSPDLIHIHVVPSPALVWAVDAAFPRRPLIVTEHWSGYRPASGRRLGLLRRLSTRRLVRRAAAVTTVSHDLAEAMANYGFTGRYRVVPNVVDTGLFVPPPAPPPRHPFRFIHVSMLRQEKNIARIVEMIGSLNRSGEAVELVVVGDGPERESAEAVARGDGTLGTTVRFVGPLEGAAIAAELQQAHALVLLSSYENSPCVIVEAMASGVPILASRVGGIPEIVTEDRGCLVEAGDWDAAERVARSMIRGERRFDSSALRDAAVTQFGIKAVASAFQEVYRDALGDAGSVDGGRNEAAGLERDGGDS
jgi:glycosyltransferase involved in cell wall biosynthesis